MKPRVLIGVLMVVLVVSLSGLGGVVQPEIARADDPDDWTKTGDVISVGNFLGSTNNVALELRTNNERALLLEPNGTSPNLIGGFSENDVTDTVAGAAIGGGGETSLGNLVTDNFGTVSGGSANRAGDDAGTTTDAVYAAVGGGFGNTANGSYSTIGGGLTNAATGVGSTIGGGEANITDNQYATISGGISNTITATLGTIGGGVYNYIDYEFATIGGGGWNYATAPFATIGGGGDADYIDFSGSTLRGVKPSKFSLQAMMDAAQAARAKRKGPTLAKASALCGCPGSSNLVTDAYGTIGGGGGNLAGGLDLDVEDQPFATVGGGVYNLSSGAGGTVGGGIYNDLGADGATISGGFGNGAFGEFATIGGGGPSLGSLSPLGNLASDAYTTVGGGGGNQAGADFLSGNYAPYATVGGGEGNVARGSYATIGGGGPTDQSDPYTSNLVTDDYGTIGGGGGNVVGDDDTDQTNKVYSTIAGGMSNAASGGWATIAGGLSNVAAGGYTAIGGGRTNTASGGSATIGGGTNNTASGTYSTVAGGRANTASNVYGFVGGGSSNSASGSYATVPGGVYNEATGNASLAAGYRAKANHTGTYVWGDSTGADIASTGINQYIVRAKGGIWLGTTSTPSMPAGRFINTSTGAYLSSGGAWTNSSDRNAKTNIVAVDSASILEKVAAMPLAMWNYKTQDATVKHIGPMAQDFSAAFGVGEDNTHIATVDADGVALAAIQGLNAKLEAENAALTERVAALERGGTTATAAVVMGDSPWMLIAIMFGLFNVLLLIGGAILLWRVRVSSR